MTDKRVVFVVAVGLVTLAFGGLAGLIVLAAFDKTIPDLLGYVITTSIGALASLLAVTRSEPLMVTAPADAPVPVVEKAAGKATKAAKKDAGHLDTVTGAILLAIGLATLIFTLLIASKIGVW